jgi:hypothetical protein
MLRPMYRNGGVPVPQRIMERVYGAERTANEAPELVMTKRLTTMGIDAEAALADMEAFEEGLANFARLRNNYGVKTHDKEAEQIQQFDTALSDLDAVIMTQYQLVAAAANIPATKLLGTAPKGFNATGQYEEASYHEELESIQAHDLTRLLERHHLCVMRSEIAPRLAGRLPVATSVVWNPLDSPTSAEVAATQKTLADRDVALAGIGAIDGMDVRQRLARDEDSGYYGVEIAERGDFDPPPPAPVSDSRPLEELARMIREIQSKTAGAEDYDPDQPRDDDGKWGEGGGSSSESESASLEGRNGRDLAMEEIGKIGGDGTRVAGSRLINGQEYLDEDIVQAKREAKDYKVQVSPEFEFEGETMRVILDGNHSLAAARLDGVEPEWEEQDSRDNDTIGLLEQGNIDDFLATHQNDTEYYDVRTGNGVW